MPVRRDPVAPRRVAGRLGEHDPARALIGRKACSPHGRTSSTGLVSVLERRLGRTGVWNARSGVHPCSKRIRNVPSGILARRAASTMRFWRAAFLACWLAFALAAAAASVSSAQAEAETEPVLWQTTSRQPKLLYVMEYDCIFDWEPVKVEAGVTDEVLAWLLSLKDRLTVTYQRSACRTCSP